MLKLSGQINFIRKGLDSTRLLKVTFNKDYPTVLRRKAIFFSEESEIPEGFSAVFINKGKAVSKNIDDNQSIALLDKDFSYISEGDIIRLEPKFNRMRVLFRSNSPNNFLLLTERCNHKCLMCSQPPKNIDDSILMQEAMELVEMLPNDLQSFGLTGGEPTLYGQQLVTLIEKFKNYLPHTALDLLSNGRTFKSIDYANEFYKVNHPDLRIAIPLYSSNPSLHNYVVQAENAFNETIEGILNLKSFMQKVEIRVVLHKQTIPGLIDLAKYISNNLRFVDHVALMGLEITGYTRANLEDLWIDPWEYKDSLSEAVNILNDYNVPVSVYNHQLCLINKDVYKFNVQSISDWKNEYIKECSECIKKHECGGFFSSQVLYKRSQNIKPILNNYAN